MARLEKTNKERVTERRRHQPLGTKPDSAPISSARLDFAPLFRWFPDHFGFSVAEPTHFTAGGSKVTGEGQEDPEDLQDWS